jgi:hypothetical protein
MLALGGWFSPQVVVGGLVLSFLIGVRFAIPLISRWFRDVKNSLQAMRKDSPVWITIYALTLLLILMTGITTVNPPQPRGDALAFYMALPKVMAASHRLTPLPGYEDFTQIGLLGEMHFAALMSLQGGLAAKIFIWPVSLATAAMLAVIGAKAGLGRRGRWIGLAALFTSTAFTNAIWNGKVDLFSAALGLLAITWSLEIGKHQNAEVIRLIGLSAGLAIVAKITYVVPLAPGLLLIILWRYRVSRDQERFFSRSFIRPLPTSLLWLGFWMAVPLLVNVLKNTLLFGNPLAPLFNTAGTATWGKPWFSPETTSKILLTYPISLVLGRFWGQGGQISPLSIAFLPLLFFVPRPRSFKNNKLAQITAAGLIGIVSWHLYNPSSFAPRYLLTSLLILLPLVARGAEIALDGSKPRFRVLAVMVVISILFVLLIGINNLTNITKTSILRTIGRVTLCEMEQYNSDASCRIAEVLNAEAELGDRVYLATFYRYWYRADIIQCLNSTGETAEFVEIEDVASRWTYLYEHGYRYVVIDAITHSDVLEGLDVQREPEGMDITTIFDEWPFVVYRISASDTSTVPQLICTQVDPPAWEVVSIDP